MARMIGRLGWHGQCSCCNGAASDAAAEAREWRREAQAAIVDHAQGAPPCECRRHWGLDEYDCCVICDNSCADLCTAPGPWGGDASVDRPPHTSEGPAGMMPEDNPGRVGRRWDRVIIAEDGFWTA